MLILWKSNRKWAHWKHCQNERNLPPQHHHDHQSWAPSTPQFTRNAFCHCSCTELSLHKQITNGNQPKFVRFNQKYDIRTQSGRFIAEEVLLKLLFTCKNICHVYLTTKQHSKLFNMGNSPKRWVSSTAKLTHKLNFKHFTCRQTNERERMHISSVDRILFEVSFAVDHTKRLKGFDWNILVQFGLHRQIIVSKSIYKLFA